MFGSIDSGVPNRSRDDGLTFLDMVWDEAPFTSQASFRATLERISADWRGRGLLNDRERSLILDAADKASDDLRP